MTAYTAVNIPDKDVLTAKLVLKAVSVSYVALAASLKLKAVSVLTSSPGTANIIFFPSFMQSFTANVISGVNLYVGKLSYTAVHIPDKDVLAASLKLKAVSASAPIAVAARLKFKAVSASTVNPYQCTIMMFPSGLGGVTTVSHHLHRAWSPELASHVIWTDTSINLTPIVTIPSSVVANLTNKEVVFKSIL